MKNKNNFVFLGISVLLTFCLLFAFNPYQYDHAYQKKAIVSQIEIQATPKQIFDYLGNSSNARLWSTFVDRIETLNEGYVADGKVGSQRRCFAKEYDLVWDEEIAKVIPNTKRQLTIINPKGFPIMTDYLVTEQIYKEIDSKTTQLTLSLFLEDRGTNLLSELKMTLAAYLIENIFAANLKQIKHYNESVQT